MEIKVQLNGKFTQNLPQMVLTRGGGVGLNKNNLWKKHLKAFFWQKIATVKKGSLYTL